MAWKRVVGTYQNWEIDTSMIVPADAESCYGEAAKLSTSDDLTLWRGRSTSQARAVVVRRCIEIPK